VVDDLVLAAEVGVLVEQGVEAVRAGGEDLLLALLHVAVERGHVRLGQHAEQVLVAARRAGSPVQVSSSPRMAKSTPARCSSWAVARAIFLARWS
jgi:hypothetical protein